MARKYDAVVYRETCKVLDALFKKHDEAAATCVNRYMRIRRETIQKERRIAELEAELGDLKKVDSISRKRA